jgi:pimeloyl-ACP methyl ester carboxylesterase
MPDSTRGEGDRTVPGSDGHPELAYVDTGSPSTPAVLLLHSLGTDTRMWLPQRDGLVRRHRVLAMDSRGHGRSGGDEVMAVGEWVADVDRVLTHAGVDRVTVVGLSMGGIQAMAYAAQHPERVAGLVVADSFARLDPEVADGKIAMLTGQAERLGMSGLADAYVADTITLTPAPPGAWDVRAAIAAMTAPAYLAAVRTCFGADVTGLLPMITAPTLVLWGERDEKTPRPLSELVAARIDGARLARVPMAGHLSNLENPAAFTAHVADFLDTRARYEGIGIG